MKERYKRTVERKFKEGEYLIFDREKGIINEDTGEVVVDLEAVIATGYDIGEKPQDFSDDENNQGKEDNNQLENSDFSEEEKESEENLKKETKEKLTSKDEIKNIETNI